MPTIPFHSVPEVSARRFSWLSAACPKTLLRLCHGYCHGLRKKRPASDFRSYQRQWHWEMVCIGTATQCVRQLFFANECIGNLFQPLQYCLSQIQQIGLRSGFGMPYRQPICLRNDFHTFVYFIIRNAVRIPNIHRQCRQCTAERRAKDSFPKALFQPIA